MAELWGALGQTSPSANTLTTAYTVPAGKRATVEVIICNRHTTTSNIRLSHAVYGAADAPHQYLLFNFPVPAGSSKSTIRFTANENDVLRVHSDTGAVSFVVNGIEETIT